MARQATHSPGPHYLDDRLAFWAETVPENEALTYLDRTWTWGQWNDRVRRLAGALSDLGIRRGDVVSFLDKNHPACVDLTIAAASLGAANAIINFRLAGDEVDYAVNDSGAKVLIVGTELMPLVEKIRDRLTTVERIIEVTPRGGPGDEYESVLADAKTAARDRRQAERRVLIMYSSGTTGRPKGVTLRRRTRSLTRPTRTRAGAWTTATNYMVSYAVPRGGSSWF
jgi:acyl-CoA synthetase (AMP-forming)/AMP-acid ligase II